MSSPAKTAGYEKEEEDRVKGLLVLFIAFGLILIVGALAFRADGGATRAALLLLALAMFLMTMVWFGWVNRYLSGVARGHDPRHPRARRGVDRAAPRALPRRG